MDLVTRSCTLPSELKAQVVEYLDARRDLAAVIQAHSSFKYFAEKRLYHYIDISDDDPYRSTLCLQVVTSRPSDIATYVQAVVVEMYSDFAKWPCMKTLLVKALGMMPNAKRVKFHAYRGSEAVFADSCIDRLEAYSGRALLSAEQLDHLSRNAPGLVKLDIPQSPLVPDKCPVYLDLDPRHRKTLRHLRINLVYTPDRTVLEIVAKIAHFYPDLQAFHISHKLELIELLSSFKQLVWFSFTSVDEDTLEEDREFVVEIHRACPTLREIDLTQNRGPWRYLEKDKRWILRAESAGTIWRLDWVPKNSVWEEAQVTNPLDQDYTYLRPLTSAEWKKRHENHLQTSKPVATSCLAMGAQPFAASIHV
ncbi:hypothetical protein FS837_006893 [Tulasnella sp. UAMH 9824]|nr:hypothetical protein FS837_006893 [Tulasnella sp. UAMH 9824]